MNFLNLVFNLKSASKYPFSFQDSASPIMEGIIDLHHDIMFFLIFVVIFVLWMLISIVLYFNKTTVHAWAGDNYKPSRVYHNATL